MNRLPRRKCIGVDGCPGGWFAINSQGTFHLFDTFTDLMLWAGGVDIYIDIPMGLPSKSPRSVEASARELLPGRGSSLFSIPCRDAVYARDYEQACHLNQAAFGKKLSLQAWYICRKIREVDASLRADKNLCHRLYESHPELTFQHLNGGRALKHSKKSAAGIVERINVLEAHLPWAAERLEAALIEYPRKKLGKDDIVDAMALAALGRVKKLILVDEAGTDDFGIPIRMVLPRATTV